MSEAATNCVLVVDDEAPVLKLIKRVLVRAKYEVIAAPDGESALEMCHGQVLAVAVIDLTLPGIDGGEVARRLRARQPGLAVVITSGYDATTARDSVSLEGIVYLQKPFTPQVLTDTVAGLL